MKFLKRANITILVTQHGLLPSFVRYVKQVFADFIV